MLAAGPASADDQPTRYPANARHSPLTAHVVERLRAVVARGSGRTDVFSKIGDSITVNAGFLGCFANPGTYDLADHAALQPTVDFFSKTAADPLHSSWDRLSLSAHVGWTSLAALGSSLGGPLTSELHVARPGFAIVMFGTNETFPATFPIYERNLRRVVETILDEGTVPILSSIPHRRDNPNLDDLVPEMNTVVRMIAESEQVPFLDYGATVADLPGFGLTKDGVHPESKGGGACRLTSEGLEGGINQRNLITLEALDRMRRFVIEREKPEDEPARIPGAGTTDDPRLVDALPFVDEGETRAGEGSLDHYSCGGRNDAGREVVYALTLPAPARVRVHVFSDRDADHEVYLLAEPSAPSCLARGARSAVADLPKGKSYVVVDSGRRAGGFRVTMNVVPEH